MDEGTLENLRMSLEYLLELVQTLFKLFAIASPEARLLAFAIFAEHRVALAPSA